MVQLILQITQISDIADVCDNPEQIAGFIKNRITCNKEPAITLDNLINGYAFPLFNYKQSSRLVEVFLLHQHLHAFANNFCRLDASDSFISLIKAQNNTIGVSNENPVIR